MGRLSKTPKLHTMKIALVFLALVAICDEYTLSCNKKCRALGFESASIDCEKKDCQCRASIGANVAAASTSTIPTSTQPGSTQPGSTQPGSTQPGSTQHGSTQPGSTQYASTIPGSSHHASSNAANAAGIISPIAFLTVA